MSYLFGSSASREGAARERLAVEAHDHALEHVSQMNTAKLCHLFEMGHKIIDYDLLFQPPMMRTVTPRSSRTLLARLAAKTLSSSGVKQ